MDSKTKGIYGVSALLFLSGAALAFKEKGSLSSTLGKLGAGLSTGGLLLAASSFTGVLGSIFSTKTAEELPEIEGAHALAEHELTK